MLKTIVDSALVIVGALLIVAWLTARRVRLPGHAGRVAGRQDCAMPESAAVTSAPTCFHPPPIRWLFLFWSYAAQGQPHDR